MVIKRGQVAVFFLHADPRKSLRARIFVIENKFCVLLSQFIKRRCATGASNKFPKLHYQQVGEWLVAFSHSFCGRNV